MKKYIAVLEIEDDEEIIDAKVTYFYSSNGMNYKATEKMELKEESEDAKNKTYEDGLIKAWELARDIICEPDKRSKIFGVDVASAILKNYTVMQAIDKVKENKERKIGDEVEFNSNKGVILEFDEDSTTIMIPSGRTVNVYEKGIIKKTGRHFPQIEEVLKQLKEDEK